MSIMELGALGEFVGAFAVVATLLYVGFQVRQNTMAVRGATMQAVFESTERVWKDNCQDLTRTEKIIELAEKKEHSSAERLFYVSWAALTFRAQENIYYQTKLGTADEIFVSLPKRVRGSLAIPAYRRAWDEGMVKPFLSDEYVAYVADVLANDPPALSFPEPNPKESA